MVDTEMDLQALLIDGQHDRSMCEPWIHMAWTTRSLTARSAMQRKNSNAPRETGWLRPIDASRRGDKLRAWEHTADVLISMKASTYEIAFCPICGCASQHGMDHIQGGRLRRTSAPEEALLSPSMG